jgi:hypothetical protein
LLKTLPQTVKAATNPDLKADTVENLSGVMSTKNEIAL